MVCDFCLKSAETAGCCFACFSAVLLPTSRDDTYARRLHAIAMAQRAVRSAGGIRPWIRAWRKRHEERFPRLQAFLGASDHDVRRFCNELALLGGPFVHEVAS